MSLQCNRMLVGQKHTISRDVDSLNALKVVPNGMLVGYNIPLAEL